MNRHPKALIGLTALILVWMAIGGTSNGSSTRLGGSEFGAYHMCQQFLNRQLRAPATAVYPDFREARVARRDGYYEVTAYVDAQNAFGALIRERFTCAVRPTGRDTWRLESLETW